jgi:hypothetical protein
MSPELQVMAAPARAYRRLTPGHDAGVAGAFGRLASAALVLGTALAIYATGRVTAGLVVSLALCWSFVLAVQLAGAVVLLAWGRPPSLGRASAIDLLFMGQGPWSLWLLAIAAWSAWLPNRPSTELAVLCTAIVPLVWTLIILFSFCGVVLQAPPWRAAALTLLHQLTVWSLTFLYIAAAIALWPRLLRIGSL